MKPDNPPAKLQEGCQFRRTNPQDEGKSTAAKPLRCRGFLLPAYRAYFINGQPHMVPYNVQQWWGRVNVKDGYRELVMLRCQRRTSVEYDLGVAGWIPVCHVSRPCRL